MGRELERGLSDGRARKGTLHTARCQQPAEHLLCPQHSKSSCGWAAGLPPKSENRLLRQTRSHPDLPQSGLTPCPQQLQIAPSHRTWVRCTQVSPSLGVHTGVPAPGCPYCAHDCGPCACCVGRAANTLSHCSLLPICMWLLCLAVRWS